MRPVSMREFVRIAGMLASGLAGRVAIAGMLASGLAGRMAIAGLLASGLAGCLKGPAAPGTAPGPAPGVPPGSAPAPEPGAPALPDFRLAPLRTIVEVAIEDFAFRPARVTIERGSAIRFVNRDDAAHDASSDDHGSWSTPLLRKNQSADVTFERAGTFPYHCDPHPWMTGEIEVK